MVSSVRSSAIYISTTELPFSSTITIRNKRRLDVSSVISTVIVVFKWSTLRNDFATRVLMPAVLLKWTTVTRSPLYKVSCHYTSALLFAAWVRLAMTFTLRTWLYILQVWYSCGNKYSEPQFRDVKNLEFFFCTMARNGDHNIQDVT